VPESSNLDIWDGGWGYDILYHSVAYSTCRSIFSNIINPSIVGGAPVFFLFLSHTNQKKKKTKIEAKSAVSGVVQLFNLLKLG